jgi:uncharacterized protein (TIGR03083 family)
MVPGGFLRIAAATSTPTTRDASDRRSTKRVLRWSVWTRSHERASTLMSSLISSCSRSGAMWRAASRHMSSMSMSTQTDSVPPQSKITASRVTASNLRAGRVPIMDTDPQNWIRALRTSHDKLIGTVRGLAADQLRAQSYCRDWTVAQVLSHLGSGAEISLLGLERTLDSQPPMDRDAFPKIWDRWNSAAPDEQASQAVVWDRRQVSVLQALDDEALAGLRMSLFGMDLDAVDMVGMRLGEHALHSWDVAVSFDPGARVLPSSVDLLVDRTGFLASRLGKAEALGGRSIGIQTADPVRRFLLTGGESISFGDWADEKPDSVLELPAEAWLRLVYGRLDPAHTPAGVKADGSAELDVLRQVFPGF